GGQGSKQFAVAKNCFQSSVFSFQLAALTENWKPKTENRKLPFVVKFFHTGSAAERCVDYQRASDQSNTCRETAPACVSTAQGPAARTLMPVCGYTSLCVATHSRSVGVAGCRRR